MDDDNLLYDYLRLGYLAFLASIFSTTMQDEIRSELGRLKRELKLFDGRVTRVEDRDRPRIDVRYSRQQKTFPNANERNESVRNLPKTTRIYRFRGIISPVETFSPSSL